MTVVVVLFFLVIGISFFCSMIEAVFLSITPTFVAIAVRDKKRYGKILDHLKEKIDKPISAILSLNTIAHTAGSSAIGAIVHEKYDNTVVTIVSIVLTLSILFFSEILPKIIGATYWKQLAPASAYIIQLMIFLVYPIVVISQQIGRMFGRPENQIVTREEMIMTAEIGVDDGILHKKESAIIKNLLMLNNIYVSDIMTPRSVIFAFEANETVDEVTDKYRPIRFSRIPVYDTSMDNIIGLTLRYKVLEASSNDQHNLKIREITSPLQSVPERTTVASVIDLFVKMKEHMALAVDEYGIVTGLVTLEDAIETLLGVEIVDEFDQITDMRQYALEQWQLRKGQVRRSGS